LLRLDGEKKTDGRGGAHDDVVVVAVHDTPLVEPRAVLVGRVHGDGGH